MAEAHQLDAGVLVLDLFDELADLVRRTDFLEHVQGGFVGAAVRRAPQAGDAGGDTGERVGAARSGQADRRSRGVLFVVGVQDQDAVQCAHQHVVDLVFLARVGEHHAHEVGAVGQFVQRIGERLADRIFIGHGDQGRHLGDQAHGRNFAMARIVDVERIMVERGQRADSADQNRHRVRIAAETTEEELHLLVHHGVQRDGVVELVLLLLVRQFAVQQQVAGFEEVAIDGQLLDRIAAILQLALVAVDVGDRGVARGRRHEAGVVGELTGAAVQLADIDDVRADRAFVNRHFQRWAAVGKRQRGFGIGLVHGSSFLLER